MTSTELVGPVRRFRIGNDWPPHWRIAVLAPRDTCAPEAVACRNHHPACDCFMAEIAESHAEWRADREFVRNAINEAVAGHPTWDRDGEPGCMCTGCVIARKVGGRYWDQQELEQNTARLRQWQALRRAGFPNYVAPEPGWEVLDL